MMIDMDDPEHWKRRKLVNKGFTPAPRPRQRGRRSAQACDEIIDAVCERGECDFVNDIAAPLPMILIGDMLGVAPEDRADLLRWSDDMVSALERQRDRRADRRSMEAVDRATPTSARTRSRQRQDASRPTTS